MEINERRAGKKEHCPVVRGRQAVADAKANR